MLQHRPAEILSHQWKAECYLWKLHLTELHFIEFKTKIDQSGLGRRTGLLRFSDVSTVFTLKDQKRWGKATWKGEMFFFFSFRESSVYIFSEKYIFAFYWRGYLLFRTAKITLSVSLWNLMRRVTRTFHLPYWRLRTFRALFHLQLILLDFKVNSRLWAAVPEHHWACHPTLAEFDVRKVILPAKLSF